MSESTRERLDAIDKFLCDADPDRKPVAESARQAIVKLVDSTPPMSPAQARRVSRILQQSPTFRRLIGIDPPEDGPGVRADITE